MGASFLSDSFLTRLLFPLCETQSKVLPVQRRNSRRSSSAHQWTIERALNRRKHGEAEMRTALVASITLAFANGGRGDVMRRISMRGLQLRASMSCYEIHLGMERHIGQAHPRRESRDRGSRMKRECIGAGEGNRTLVCSLGSCRSTIELRPRSDPMLSRPRAIRQAPPRPSRLTVNLKSPDAPRSCPLRRHAPIPRSVG